MTTTAVSPDRELARAVSEYYYDPLGFVLFAYQIAHAEASPSFVKVHLHCFIVHPDHPEYAIRVDMHVEVVNETIQGCSRMRGPVNPVQLRGFGTHTHIHAVCSPRAESLERFGSQHVHAPASQRVAPYPPDAA
jgi:hypothetical protein